jgi:hypothetical protein
MTCPITVRLGVYALGAADQAECELIEAHLPTCRACRTELECLEPLPGLLAGVPLHLIRSDPAPAHAPAVHSNRTRQIPPDKQGALGRRWRGVAVAAAAALAAAAAAGLTLADSRATSSPPAAVTLSGANPVTHVRVTVSLTRTSWGSAIRLEASGLPLNQECRLIVHSRSGGSEVAGTWDAWRAGPVSIPASAGWFPNDISSLQVATASRNLVTVTVARPDRAPQALSHSSGSSH